MADRPLVSIILPVYNGEQTLQATMDSLLSQTFRDFELVIGIDGSTDGSKSIVESYGDARIRLIEHSENLGLANNVNALIALLHPDSLYIAMAEQDDVYVVERLEWQVAVMETQPEVGLVSGIAEFRGDGEPVLFPGILVYEKPFPQGTELFKYLYVNQLKVVNTCMMFRKSTHTMNDLKFRNTYGNFNVDWDYVLRFSLMSQVFGIPKVLVRMDRGLANNSVTRDKVAQHQASRQLLKDFREEFPQLVSADLYSKALKQHRKIELGHLSKREILLMSLYYYFLYFDTYFLTYLYKRIRLFLNNKMT